MLNESGATRVSVRRVHDVIFPEIVSFPMKQRLNSDGAFEDMTLAGPHVSDTSEAFDLVAGETDVDDVLHYDSLVKENAQSFRRTAVTEVMCALDPDPDAEAEVPTLGADGLGDADALGFSSVDPDIKEAENVTPDLTSSEARELVTSS